MDFSSRNFLFVFLPLVYALYLLCGPRMRGILLLLASLFFYASANHLYLFLFLVLPHNP